MTRCVHRCIGLLHSSASTTSARQRRQPLLRRLLSCSDERSTDRRAYHADRREGCDQGAAHADLDEGQPLKSPNLFGLTVDGLNAGEAAIVDAKAFGWPVRSLSLLTSSRRLHGAGGAEPLRDVPSRRWTHAETAAGHGRRPAMGQEARQSLFQAHEDPCRCTRIPQTVTLTLDQKIGTDRAEEGHAVHQAHPHQERDAVEILGTAGLSRRACAFAVGLRHASERALSADGQSRPFSGRHRRLPHHAARSETEARLFRALPSRRLQPHPAAGSLCVLQEMDLAGLPALPRRSRSSTPIPITTTATR